MRARTLAPLALLGLLAGSCGGGGGSPSGPNPADLHSVSVVVFYDENGNGSLDVTEEVRLGGVTVSVAGRTAQTEPHTGRAIVAGVPAGTQTVEIRALPPFYQPGALPSVTVPAASDVLLAAALPIGANRPNTYMAFGDSITAGDGSRSGQGYPPILERQLLDRLARAEVVNQGLAGTRSDDGAARIGTSLRKVRPAFTLILYGTNDWNDCANTVPCFTIDKLRTMIQKLRTAESHPFLATIIPANPELNPETRNLWVSRMDDLIRDLAREEGAALVDLEAAFLNHGNLPSLFSDHVHPNDDGYRIIADEFFKVITQASTSAASSSREATPFDVEPPGESRPLESPATPQQGAVRSPRARATGR